MPTTPPCSTSRPNCLRWNCGSPSIKLERWSGQFIPTTCSTASSAGSASGSRPAGRLSTGYNRAKSFREGWGGAERYVSAPVNTQRVMQTAFLLLVFAAEPTRADVTGHQNYVEHVPDTDISFPMV